MTIPPEVQRMFETKVGPLGDDTLLRAILSVRTWHVEWQVDEWLALLGDSESPYGSGRGPTLLDACLDALRCAVRWGETDHMRPDEVAFINAVVLARGGI